METTELYVGKVFKNYKEMCIELNQPIKGGDAKKAHMKNLKFYFEYELKGYQILITEVFEDEIPSDISNNMYSDLLQKILLDVLLKEQQCHSNKKRLIFTNNELVEKCRVANKDLASYRHHQTKLSEQLNINISYIMDFYLSTDSKISSMIKYALNKLEGK